MLVASRDFSDAPYKIYERVRAIYHQPTTVMVSLDFGSSRWWRLEINSIIVLMFLFPAMTLPSYLPVARSPRAHLRIRIMLTKFGTIGTSNSGPQRQAPSSHAAECPSHCREDDLLTLDTERERDANNNNNKTKKVRRRFTPLDHKCNIR